MAHSPYQTAEQKTSKYWANSDSQSDSEMMEMTVSHKFQHNTYAGSDEPVVTSHGKVCIWCEQGSEIYDQNRREQNQHQQGQYELNEHDQSQQPPDQGRHRQTDDGMQGVPMNDLPPLLYRWSNRDSQGVNTKERFLAGLFCNREYFNPEDCPESDFESFFRSHVTKKRVQSPFISTFRSPLAPIHRAIASQKGATVTIVDTSRLDTKVFYALPLAIRTRTFTHSWKGYGEYLIWSHIPTEAIAFTFEISSLEQIASDSRDVNRLLQLPLIRSVPRCNQKLREMLAAKRKSPFKSGCTLRKLLTLLQAERVHWEHIAERFAKAWGWKNEGERKVFIEGVQSEPIGFSGEELSDSESEALWPILQKTSDSTSKKMDLAFDSLSDLDYEPPETEEDSEGSPDEEGPSNHGTQSMSMDDRTETVDEGNFSTHETISSGLPMENFEDRVNTLPQIVHDRIELRLPNFLYRGLDHHLEQMQTRVAETEFIDLTIEDDNDWPSDDCGYLTTPTPCQRKIPRRIERGTSSTRNLMNVDRMNVEHAPQIQWWSPDGWVDGERI